MLSKCSHRPTSWSNHKLIEQSSQHFRPHDRRPRRLLSNIHALLPRRLAQELPPLRLPCDQLYFSDHTGISVLELLEVCLMSSNIPNQTFLIPLRGNDKKDNANLSNSWGGREKALADKGVAEGAVAGAQ